MTKYVKKMAKPEKKINCSTHLLLNTVVQVTEILKSKLKIHKKCNRIVQNDKSK